MGLQLGIKNENELATTRALVAFITTTEEERDIKPDALLVEYMSLERKRTHATETWLGARRIGVFMLLWMILTL